MELTVFYKVFNEIDFIKESLQSIYQYADKIVIFEYCLQSMREIIRPDRVTEYGLSTDGTTEAIKEFPDPHKKIEYHPVGFIYGAESIPYQMIVDNAEVGEYIWVLDGDIVYSRKLAENIRAWVDSGEYDVIWVPERVFYHDLHHEKHIFFTHHQRVFRVPVEGCFYFPKCFEVHWMGPDKSCRWFKRDNLFTWEGDDKQYRSIQAHEVDHGIAFHYALVRDIQRILEKLVWQYNMIDRAWNNVTERKACAGYKDPLEFKLKTHDYFLNHEPHLRRAWADYHPDMMYNNPWMDYRWDEKPIEINYRRARKLIGDPGEK